MAAVSFLMWVSLCWSLPIYPTTVNSYISLLYSTQTGLDSVQISLCLSSIPRPLVKQCIVLSDLIKARSKTRSLNNPNQRWADWQTMDLPVTSMLRPYEARRISSPWSISCRVPSQRCSTSAYSVLKTVCLGITAVSVTSTLADAPLQEWLTIVFESEGSTWLVHVPWPYNFSTSISVPVGVVSLQDERERSWAHKMNSLWTIDESSKGPHTAMANSFTVSIWISVKWPYICKLQRMLYTRVVYDIAMLLK